MNGQPPYLFNFQDFLARFLQRGRNALLSVAFPFACPGCAFLLPYPAVVCESCAVTLKKIEEPFCLRCGTPFPANWRVKRCELCKTRRSALTRTRSVYFYEDLVREMVRAAKYRGKPRLLRFFGDQLLMIALLLPRADAIVPVPLHRKRQWQRRFNQARLLSEHVGQLSGIPVRECLQKKKKTVAQSSLSGIARRKNLKGAFSCIEGVPIPKVILLIDDVITTGATMEECARTLRRNGAKKVYALTIARAVKKF